MNSRLAARGSRLAAIGATLAVVAVTLWAYAPVAENGFVWDDGANLIAARAHWGQGAEGILWAFTTPFFGHYQPVTWLSYRADLLLSGATPRGVHATNLAFHLVASVLLGLLAAWFVGRSAAPAGATGATGATATPHPALVAGLVGGALFALHPLHVETVAWATERRDLLSTVGVFAAVLVHLRTTGAGLEPSRGRGWVAALHAFAALARAQVSLPFVLLALDVWPLGRLRTTGPTREAWKRLLAEKSISLAIAAASAAAALWAQTASGALTSTSEHGLVERIVQTGYSLAFYPAALVYRPAYLPLYERPVPFPAFAPEYLFPALAAVALLGLSWIFRRRFPAFAVAVASYVLFVLPVSGAAQSGIQLVADRYAYLATAPLLLFLVCGGVARWRERRQRWAAVVALLAVVAALAWAALETRRQTRVWRDDEALWRQVLAHSASVLADNNLGQILYARGESGPALAHLARALERAPAYPRPWRALAAILEAPGPADGPERGWVAATLDRAAAAAPGAAVSAYASGLAWLRAGDVTRAERQLRRALAIEPAHEGARLALARLAERRDAAPALSAPAAPTPP